MVARRGISVYTGSGGTEALTAFRFTDDGKSKTGNVTGNYDKVLHQITGTLSNLGAITSSVGFSGDGSGLTNLTASEVAAAGNTGDVQFNSGDDLAADSAFTFVPSTHTLGLGESSVSASLTASHALTITAAAASTWSTSAGDLTLDSAAGSLVLTGGESAADAVKIQADAAAGGIDIDAGTAGVDLDSTGAVNLSGSSMVLDASGVVELNSTAGAISIGNDDVDQNINIGTQGERTVNLSTGAFASTVNIGNSTGATTLDLDAGTGGVDLDSTGAVNLSGSSMVLDASGVVELNSTAGAISIGNDDVDQNINIGTQGERTVNLSTGAFASTVNIGNSTGATTLDLDAGTGGVDLDSTGAVNLSGSSMVLDASGVVELNSTAGAISVGNDANTGAINVGTGASARTITVGADESTKVDVNALEIELDSGGDIDLNATTVAVTGDMTVSGDSTLGDAVADVATVNGRLQIGKFDPATAADAVLLETMATTPATYNGSMIYLSVTAASGTNSGVSFANPDKWYFCESGSWYPSPFNSL